MLKRTLTILFLFCALAFSQNIDSLLNVLESHQRQDEWMDILSGNKNIQLIYLGTEYNNDSYFSGRDIGLHQYNISAQMSYSFRNFTLSAAAIMYESLYPPIQLATISANYRIPLKFPINIDLAYDRYIFFNDSDTLMSMYPNGLGVTLSHHKTYWGASTDFSLLLGSDGLTYQLDPTVYGKFRLISWKNNSLSIKPEISFLFGSEQTALVRAPWQRGQNLAKPIGDGPGNGQGNGNGDGSGDSPGDGNQVDPELSHAFGLLNTEINLNIILDLGDMNIGICIQNNRPRSVVQEIAYAPTSLISLSAGYVFSFLTK